jgi:hypothetical protein
MTNKTESLDKDSKPSSYEELEKKVADLSSALEQLLKQQVQTKTISNKAEQIQPNEFIKVMSLLGNRLNLSTQPHGRGKTFSFDRFGEVKNILYSDLIEINNNQKNFLEAGYYYILDDRVIDAEALNDVYEKILDKKQIETILSSKEGSIAMFQKANPKQQSVIIGFITEKILNGESVDFNIVNEIKRVSGIDINEKVRNTQEIRKSSEEKA